MPKKALDGLTESMFYLLMALNREERCGIDAAAFIERKTAGRLLLGPATLYTILGKFLEQGYIEEVSVEGRKRTYCITEKGKSAYQALPTQKVRKDDEKENRSSAASLPRL